MAIATGPGYNPQLATSLQAQQQMTMYAAEKQQQRDERQARERAALAKQAAAGRAAANEAQGRQASQHAYEQAVYGGQARAQEANLQSERDKALAKTQAERDDRLGKQDEASDWRRAGFQSQRDYDAFERQRIHDADAHAYHSEAIAQTGQQQLLQGDQSAFYQHQRDRNQNEYDRQRQDQQFQNQGALQQQHVSLQAQLNQTQLNQAEESHRRQLENGVTQIRMALQNGEINEDTARVATQRLRTGGLDEYQIRSARAQEMTQQLQQQQLQEHTRHLALQNQTAEHFAASTAQDRLHVVQVPTGRTNPDGTPITRPVSAMMDRTGGLNWVPPDQSEEHRAQEASRSRQAAEARLANSQQFHHSQMQNEMTQWEREHQHLQTAASAIGAPPEAQEAVRNHTRPAWHTNQEGYRALHTQRVNGDVNQAQDVLSRPLPGATGQPGQPNPQAPPVPGALAPPPHADPEVNAANVANNEARRQQAANRILLLRQRPQTPEVRAELRGLEAEHIGRSSPIPEGNNPGEGIGHAIRARNRAVAAGDQLGIEAADRAQARATSRIVPGRGTDTPYGGGPAAPPPAGFNVRRPSETVEQFHNRIMTENRGGRGANVPDSERLGTPQHMASLNSTLAAIDSQMPEENLFQRATGTETPRSIVREMQRIVSTAHANTRGLNEVEAARYNELRERIRRTADARLFHMTHLDPYFANAR